jgi:hypothetical protein
MRKILQSEKTVKRVDTKRADGRTKRADGRTKRADGRTKRADGRTKRADGIEGYLMAVRVSACLLITIYKNNT